MDLTARPVGSKRSFVLLAPAGACLAAFHGDVKVDGSAFQDLLSKMQRLRGRVYLNDGAIQQSDLTRDGRHVSGMDKESWHLLTVNEDGRVMGCARILSHSCSTPFEGLTVSHSALAKCPEWGNQLRKSIEGERQRACQANFLWLEMGGWALSEELRGTTEALLYALATYAWSQLMGGAIGISTVTERNGSSSILRRLGGQSLENGRGTLPAYYDGNYRCQMEVLRFDSRIPNQKYRSTIESLRVQMAQVSVVSAASAATWDSCVSNYLPASASRYWLNAARVSAQEAHPH